MENEKYIQIPKEGTLRAMGLGPNALKIFCTIFLKDECNIQGIKKFRGSSTVLGGEIDVRSTLDLLEAEGIITSFFKPDDGGNISDENKYYKIAEAE